MNPWFFGLLFGLLSCALSGCGGGGSTPLLSGNVDVSSVTLVANPTAIENNNLASSTLTATVAMPSGVSAQGIPVNFTMTGSGTLSAPSVTTDASGKASVTLISGTVGTVNVTATANSKSSPTTLKISSEPLIIAACVGWIIATTAPTR